MQDYCTDIYMSNMNTDALASLPFTGHTEYAGIDKVRITYPLDPEYSDGSDDLFTKHGVHKTLGRGGDLAYARGNLPWGNGDTLFFEVRKNATEAIVEFNPSRSLDPNGSTLCSPESVENLVIAIIQFLANHTVFPRWGINTETGEFIHDKVDLWPLNWREWVLIARLDIARDIYVPFKGFKVSHLIHIKKTYYNNDVLYRNDGEIQTISWGRINNVRHSFYNKSLLHDNQADGGWFRFEIQARTNYLKKRGIAHIGDITSQKSFEFLWERWNLSNFGGPLTVGEGQAILSEALTRVTSGIKAQTFLGIAHSMANNLPINMNPRTVSIYRTIGRSCGFNLGDRLESYGGIQIWLNFQKGLGEILDEFTETPEDVGENIRETIGV